MTTRAEHLDWCKQRALEYVNRGDLSQAFASMGRDLAEHEETQDHPGIAAGMGLMIVGGLGTPQQMRKFIDGFH